MDEQAIIPGVELSPLSWRYTLAVSLRMIRILFTCKNKECKHVWAYEYRRGYTFLGDRQGNPPRCDLYRVTDGEQKTMHHILCPLCGRIGNAHVVKGTVTQKKCDASCQSAKGSTCNCSCGGENHGIVHLVAQVSGNRAAACRS